MKKLIQKADEMEMAINMKAARNAYAFLTAAVMVYSIVITVSTGELPTVFLFGCLSGVIFWGTKLYETHRLTKGAENEE